MKKTILYSTFMLLIVATMVLTACGPALTQAPETVPPTVGSITIPTSTSEVISPTAEAISPTTESTAGNIPKGGTINYVNIEPALLNPYLRPEQIAWQAIALISTGLVDLNSKGDWVLELASEFPSVDKGTLSADGTTVTWNLRPGLKWSDGTPLTTDDLVFTWEVCSNPQSGCAINAGFNKIQTLRRRINLPRSFTTIVHILRTWHSSETVSFHDMEQVLQRICSLGIGTER
jgi:peptide/nickel transport system substrate-binding protein